MASRISGKQATLANERITGWLPETVYHMDPRLWKICRVTGYLQHQTRQQVFEGSRMQPYVSAAFCVRRRMTKTSNRFKLLATEILVSITLSVVL